MEFKKVNRVLIQTLILNWLVALAKISIGFFSGSLSILSDGFHSLFDGTSNVIGMVGIRLAQKPIDMSHPYGHKKFESFASFGVVFLIFLAAYEISKGIFERFRHPQTPEVNLLIFAVMIGSLIVNILVARYEAKKAKELSSVFLQADSLHTKSDIFVSLSVIFGVLAVQFGFPIFDPIIAIFVVFAILKLAVEIFRETSHVLCDEVRVDEQKIREIASTVEGIKEIHQIRTRGDHNLIFSDMHILVEPELSIREAHFIAHTLKKRIKEEIPQMQDIVIHIEPKM